MKAFVARLPKCCKDDHRVDDAEQRARQILILVERRRHVSRRDRDRHAKLTDDQDLIVRVVHKWPNNFDGDHQDGDE